MDKKDVKNASRERKRQTKRLDFKKVFIFLIFVVALIFILASRCTNCPDLSVITSTTSDENNIVQKEDTTVNMTVVGDIMCHSTNFKAAYNSSTKTYDFSSVFTGVANYISNADISIGNLETTFSGEAKGYSGYPTFNTPAALATDLKELGIDVLSTANNHSLDKGYSGLVSTLDELDKVEIAHTGTYRTAEDQNKIITKDVNGITFAFLSFTYGTNGIPVPSGKDYCINLIDKDLIKEQVSKAKELNPDVIVVNMHWGIEYQTSPNSEQTELANFLFENGVDIILGSHPHVLQKMEKRTVTLDDGSTKDGFVIYSLGNFMSGQVITNTRYSVILNLKITKHSDDSISIDSYDYIPIYMQDKGSGVADRYKIIDVNTEIGFYESGCNSVSESLYKNLKSAYKFITSIMGEDSIKKD